jgi:hypothetical protein
MERRPLDPRKKKKQLNEAVVPMAQELHGFDI